MAAQEKNCYLGINGKKYGPVSEEDIRTLHTQGKVTGDTPFIRKGMTDWVSLSSAGIITAMASADDLPPLPEADGGQEKKSKLGCLAAALGLLLVVAVMGMIGVMTFVSNNTAKPANSVSEEKQIEDDASAETARKEAEASEPAEAQTSEVAPEIEKIETPAPTNYVYGFLNFEYKKASSSQTVEFIFHNNTGNRIEMIKLQGKWLDADGVVIGSFAPSATNILANDRVKMGDHNWSAERAATIRIEKLFVGIDYAGNGDYTGRELPNDGIIPVISLDQLTAENRPSYYYTGTALQAPTATPAPAPTPEPTPAPAAPAPAQAPQVIIQVPPSNVPSAGGTTSNYDYVIPYSSSMYLTQNDISGFSASQLRIARNEIYARHGRMFTSADLQNYFNNQAWYYPTIPANQFKDSTLNDFEKKNIDLLQKRENALK